MPTDHDNNVFMLEFSGTSIGRRNAKTGEITIWPTPTAGSKPRRGRFDEQNRLWFAEYGSNGIGMFDPKTDKITEWVLPTKWDTPYDVVPAKNGEGWTGSMHNDLVTRLDPKSNTITPNLLPRTHNQRPARVRGGDRPAAGAVGRQQPRRLGRAGGAARLSRSSSGRNRDGRGPLSRPFAFPDPASVARPQIVRTWRPSGVGSKSGPRR